MLWGKLIFNIVLEAVAKIAEIKVAAGFQSNKLGPAKLTWLISCSAVVGCVVRAICDCVKLVPLCFSHSLLLCFHRFPQFPLMNTKYVCSSCTFVQDSIYIYDFNDALARFCSVLIVHVLLPDQRRCEISKTSD